MCEHELACGHGLSKAAGAVAGRVLRDAALVFHARHERRLVRKHVAVKCKRRERCAVDCVAEQRDLAQTPPLARPSSPSPAAAAAATL
eukprot:15759-Chlamydomonas_euryale.AAC.6